MYVKTSYGGQLSDEWKVRNVVQEGVISSGKVFNFYLNKVISGISKQPAGCTSKCNKELYYATYNPLNSLPSCVDWI